MYGAEKQVAVRERRQDARAENQVRGRPEGRIIARVAGMFRPGLRLAGEFYAEAVRPLLDQEFPGLEYAAGLLGPGSEVLGFDTERSTDHDWGPRLQVFLGAPDAGRLAGAVDEML